MEIINVILLTIGGLAFLEGLVVSINPKLVKTLTKNTKSLRKAGIFELIVAIILLILGAIL